MGLHDRNPARVRHTSEGGIAIRLTNRTGGNTVKGTVVSLSSSYDNAVMSSPGDSRFPCGVMYENGVSDGSECWVVVYGRAQVLLKDGVAGVHGYWLGVSDTAGRADCISDPGSQTIHDREIGHCMESVSSGTNVLVYGILHYN